MTNQASHGADSEVGRLRTVMLHRPGPELQRLTPRNNDKLLFDGVPWVSRAQDEHDAFAQALRDRDVEVLYLTDLLTETLQSAEAREHAITGAMVSLHLGDTLRAYLTSALRDQSPDDLSLLLTAGVRNDEVRGGHGLVTSLLGHDDFLIDPLPNLLFTRDSSVWVRDRVAITSLAMPARERETQLTELIYTEHPRFAGTPTIHGWQREHVEGGDVLLLASGVVAVGVGERTTPAGAERLARQLFGAGLAHTVLAVPIAQERATMHLDTVCTMVDVDKIVMYPNVADSLTAYAVTVADHPGDSTSNTTDDSDLVLRVADAEPFLVAAAKAMSIDTLHQIDTGLDPVTAEREQWDDGNNTLAISPRVAVAYERNIETNSRLEEAGVEVVAISGSELGSGRGGPRCMSCPVSRDALPA
jgi:arginine deiminase